METDPLTEKVIGCAIEVHRNLGPGLLESIYERCMARELEIAKISYNRQVPLPVNYKGIRMDCGHRIDLLVESSLVIELKTVESLTDIHKAQILTYMKLADVKKCLLINFNVALLKNGLKRFIM